MKVLSFDVGIKNLAFCLIDTEKLTIDDWGILNICTDPVCEHHMKHRKCDNSAKKILKDTNMKLCLNHTKLKGYKNKKFKNVPKHVNPMLEQGKKIVEKLDEKPDFLNVDIVLIENQPALKNPTMKSVQMILYTYFLIEGIKTLKTIKDIQMINARNKLKAYTGPAIQCDIKDRYKKTKFLAVKYCEIMIHENTEIDPKFHELFKESKKKDDLADAYLQGMYFVT